MNATSSDWKSRWIVRGAIRVLTPIAIRSGEVEKVTRDGDETFDRSLIVQDYCKNPLIPATAIKGLLRSIAAQSKSSSDLEPKIIRLFGDMPRADENSDSSLARGGSAEFRDAFTKPDGRSHIVDIGQTKINAGRKTADKGMLRSGQFVGIGALFDLEIIIDRAPEADISVLLGLLKTLNERGPQSSLGGNGGGLVSFECIEVLELNKAQAKAWLEADLGQNWSDFAQTAKVNPEKFSDASNLISVNLSLPIDGHFLVARKKNKDPRAKEEPETDPVNHLPLSPTGGPADRAWLPKSSLKGALLAQAKRICRTLGVNFDTTNWIGTPVEELFGSTQQSGRLRCGDLFQVEIGKPVRMDLVAIDRLSGSTSGSAKFALEAWEAPLLEGILTLQLERNINQKLTGQPEREPPAKVTDAAIGLLILVLRDLSESDICLGFGARKGFGRVACGKWNWKAAIEQFGDCSEIIKKVTAFGEWADKHQKTKERGEVSA